MKYIPCTYDAWDEAENKSKKKKTKKKHSGWKSAKVHKNLNSK